MMLLPAEMQLFKVQHIEVCIEVFQRLAQNQVVVHPVELKHYVSTLIYRCFFSMCSKHNSDENILIEIFNLDFNRVDNKLK